MDLTTPWSTVQGAGTPYVLHDSLCSATPPVFLARCVATCVARNAVVVGVRPVTDTVKVVHDGAVGATVDRDALVTVASPVVLPATVVAALDRPPSTDFPELVASLRRRYPVVFEEAPPEAGRVASVEDVELLAALTGPHRPEPAARPASGPPEMSP